MAIGGYTIKQNCKSRMYFVEQCIVHSKSQINGYFVPKVFM
jgi:hypothetical protein